MLKIAKNYASAIKIMHAYTICAYWNFDVNGFLKVP